MGVYNFIGATKTLSKNEELLARRYDTYKNWFAFLLNGGIPRVLVPIILAQIQLESGDFSDKKATQMNNYSGIRPAKNRQFQDGVYNTSGNGQFATYKSKDRWLQDFKRIISMNGKLGKPIDAKDFNNYVNRLKANNYFGSESANSYLSKMNNFVKRNNAAYKWAMDFHNKMYPKGATSTPIVNTSGWNENDQANVDKQKHQVILEKGLAEYNMATKGYYNPEDINREKKDLFNIETWSTSTKIFAGVGVLAALAIITR